MGTRGYIAKQVGPDAYLTIFSAIESYPEHVGRLLLEYYSSPEMVDKLIALGDIWRLEKSLEPNPNEQHDLAKKQDDVVLSFARDAGEKNCEAEIMTLRELDDLDVDIRYIYVFTEEKEWKYFVPGFAERGFRDIQSDLAHPENIPIRAYPNFEKLQAEVLAKLGKTPLEPSEEPEPGPEMKMT